MTRFTHIKKLLADIPDGGVKLGLENMREMDCHFGAPSHAFASIHIAGTNGKGSVATKIAKTLEISQYRTGLYTSPHISSPCERIQINSQMISEEELDALLKRIYTLSTIKPTYFEIVTMAAFLYFAMKRIEVAVIETGMGGRLDATNIVHPLLSIITSIGYDHTRYLGTTLEQIAREKGGIIKPKAPLLLGPQARPEEVFHTLAKEKKSPVYQMEGEFEDFEKENTAIAKKACTLLPFEVKSAEGFSCTPPCRFEIIHKKIPLVIDVAHNPSAIEALFRRLKKSFPHIPIRALVAFSADKEIDACLEKLLEKTTGLHLTQAFSPRAALAAQMIPRKNMTIEPYLPLAFQGAYEKAVENKELLLITGTFYFMDWIKKRIGAL